MGLDVKDIQHRLCRTAQVSTRSSYTFLERHPLVSGVLVVCFILYLFLSYIYSFLVYMSPFLVCTAIFVRIFWSSEQTQFRYVKKEEKKGEQKIVEPKLPKIPLPNNGRRELFKYPSQNAISRRRNFREKKWDVYGGLEERAKNLSAVFHNEFTARNTKSKDGRAFEKGESSLDYGLSSEKSQAPKRQTLRSEPSMRDLVLDAYGTESDGADIGREKMDGGDDEDEEEAPEDRNKAIEWTENDQKNLMDLGISELERNRRLESLMARRRERKLYKLHLEKGLTGKRSLVPSHIAPLLITRGNPYDSPRDFEGIDCLEMPGSAPSVMPRSPFDIPYDPSEEKPNLTGDGFYQEFTRHKKDMPFCRHESSTSGPHFPSEPIQDHGAGDPYLFFNNERKYSHSRFRRLPDKGNHDSQIDQLIYNEGGESGFEAPNPVRKGEETAHDEDGKCKTDMADMEDEKLENAHETKSISDHTREPGSTPNISNVETAEVSEKPGPRLTKPHENVLNFPVSATTTTTDAINESMHDDLPSPFHKRHENMFFTERRHCHTPTYSIASDLQVEVSEIGSPTSTVDENAETNSTTDRDSVIYDGDIDRGVSSGDEDLWGASFHGRQAHGVGEEEVNNTNIATPMALRQIDEENVADVSCMSSGSDMLEDTPTHALNGDHNIFGYKKYSLGKIEVPQSSNFSYVSSPPKQFMNSSVDLLHNETLSERSEEWCNLSENLINELQAMIDVNVNNSAATATEQDNTENSRSNEVPATSFMRQESIDDTSIYSIASSPRSVLPDKTIADEVSSSAYDQQTDIGAEQSNTEDMAQETFNDERSPDTMPQNIQPLMDDTTNESHNVGLNQSQDQTNPPENSMEESNIFGNAAEASNTEEQDKIKNDESSEGNSSHLTRQEAIAESTRLAEKTSMEDTDQNSRELVDDKVPSTELIEDDKNDKPESGNVHEDLPQPSVTEPTIPSKEANEGLAKDS